MVDDTSSQPENENKNNLRTDTDTPEDIVPGQVDSLVVNDIGGITAGLAGQKKGRIKNTAHKFLSRGLALWPSTKNQKIAGGLIMAVLLVGGITGIYALRNTGNIPTPPSPVVQRIEKTTEPSRLTGVEIPIKLNKRPVTAVMIENHPEARPQSGLSKAGIVFEAVAEGGITRFNALFLEGQPKNIGPVRSVRPYYIDLFLPFDAAIAHAGGSADGLNKLKRLHVKNLDYLLGTSAYHRISSRPAPHNLYTSMAALDKVSKAKKFIKSTFTSWLRKPEDPAKTPKVKKIDMFLSGPLYNVHYDYDAKKNAYKRSEGGRRHIDAYTNKQLEPKVVIALVMHYSHNGEYSVYKTSGKGPMFVFQDGRVQRGNWKKGGSRDPFKFFDSKGRPLALNPGQTWVTLLAGTNDIKYSH